MRGNSPRTIENVESQRLQKKVALCDVNVTAEVLRHVTQ